MRVFVIGPQGSGKTTFFAMLSRYVAQNLGCGVTLVPNNGETKAHITDVQLRLEQGKWPFGTMQGRKDCRTLSWTLRWPGAEHRIEMLDAAGQDLEPILLSAQGVETVHRGSGTQTLVLTDHQKALRTKIDESEVLVCMLDLDGFRREVDGRNQTLLAEMIQSIFVQPAWLTKQRMIVLSKADLYGEQLPPSDWADPEKVRQFLLTRFRCRYYSLDPLVFGPGIPNVEYLAAASVLTETVVDEKGETCQKPGRCLESLGMADLLKVLCIAISQVEQRQQERRRLEERQRLDELQRLEKEGRQKEQQRLEKERQKALERRKRLRPLRQLVGVGICGGLGLVGGLVLGAIVGSYSGIEVDASLSLGGLLGAIIGAIVGARVD